MDTLIFAIGIYGVFALNALTMYVLAWFLTEVIKLPWKVKPFNCRGCLAFWFTSLSGIAVGWALAGNAPLLRYLFAGGAVLTGLVNYLYIKSKFQIYE